MRDKSSRMLFPVLLLLVSGCGDRPEEPALAGVGVRRQATTSPAPPLSATCWKQGALPGTDPQKQGPASVCSKAVAKTAAASFLAKQALHAKAIKAKRPAWKKLPVAERIAKMRALKDSFFAVKGGN